MQSQHITTNVVRSNPVHGEVLSMENYIMKFVSDLWQVGGFLRVLGFPHQYNWPPQYNWNIVESVVKNHQTNIVLAMKIHLAEMTDVNN